MKTTVTELAENFIAHFSRDEIKQIAKKMDDGDTSGIDESLTEKFSDWVHKAFRGNEPTENVMFYVVSTACIRLIAKG